MKRVDSDKVLNQSHLYIFLSMFRWMTTLFMESTTTVLGTRLTMEQVKSRMRTRIMLNPESCFHNKMQTMLCVELQNHLNLTTQSKFI